MSLGMPGCRYECHTGQDLGFSVQLLPTSARRIQQFRQGVILRMPSGRELADCVKKGRPAEERVPAAMVEVQMAVSDFSDLVNAQPLLPATLPLGATRSGR